MLSKLIIGTAGLSGFMYGRNPRAVGLNDAAALIRHALACGVDRFDTSPLYGQAERVLRQTLNGRGVVWTKVRDTLADVDFSRVRLGAAQTYVLLHNWRPRWFHRWVTPLHGVPIDGVTVYAHDLPGRVRVDQPYIQCDWNLLNQVNLPRIFGRRRGFIARSVFLQGALAGGVVPVSMQDVVDYASDIANEFNLPLYAFALRAALENDDFDHVVVGPTTLDELDSCIRIAQMPNLGTEHVIKRLDLGRSQLTDPRMFP